MHVAIYSYIPIMNDFVEEPMDTVDSDSDSKNASYQLLFSATINGHGIDQDTSVVKPCISTNMQFPNHLLNGKNSNLMLY